MLPDQLARKPKVAVAPAPRLPFQLSFVTVYGLAVWDVRPPQSWVNFCPAVNVTVTVQPVVVVVPVLVTVTPPWKPPGHWPCWA